VFIARHDALSLVFRCSTFSMETSRRPTQVAMAPCWRDPRGQTGPPGRLSAWLVRLNFASQALTDQGQSRTAAVGNEAKGRCCGCHPLGGIQNAAYLSPRHCQVPLRAGSSGSQLMSCARRVRLTGQIGFRTIAMLRARHGGEYLHLALPCPRQIGGALDGSCHGVGIAQNRRGEALRQGIWQFPGANQWRFWCWPSPQVRRSRRRPVEARLRLENATADGEPPRSSNWPWPLQASHPPGQSYWSVNYGSSQINSSYIHGHRNL
jgi:hypothetical protein